MLRKRLTIGLLFLYIVMGGLLFFTASTQVNAQITTVEIKDGSEVYCKGEDLLVDQPFSKNIELNKPRLNIKLPTVSFRDKIIQTRKVVCRDAEGTINAEETKKFADKPEHKIIVPHLCDYIFGIFKLAMGLAIILAIIIIMHNGLKWAVSSGSTDAILSAKKGIGNALIGLMLLLGGVSLLQIINPDLIRCNPIEILKPNIPDNSWESIDSLQAQGLAVIKSKEGDGRFVTGQMMNELTKVLKKIKENNVFATPPVIKGASRSTDDQLSLFVKNCALKGTNTNCEDGEVPTCKPWGDSWPQRSKIVADLDSKNKAWNFANVKNYLQEIYKDRIKEVNCPHTSGVGLDLYAPVTDSVSVTQENLTKTSLNRPRFALQEKLIEAMTDENFCVLTRTNNRGPKFKGVEHWHFELWDKSKPNGLKSPSGTKCQKPYNKGDYNDWRP